MHLHTRRVRQKIPAQCGHGLVDPAVLGRGVAPEMNVRIDTHDWSRLQTIDDGRSTIDDQTSGTGVPPDAFD